MLWSDTDKSCKETIKLIVHVCMCVSAFACPYKASWTEWCRVTGRQKVCSFKPSLINKGDEWERGNGQKNGARERENCWWIDSKAVKRCLAKNTYNTEKLLLISDHDSFMRVNKLLVFMKVRYYLLIHEDAIVMRTSEDICSVNIFSLEYIPQMPPVRMALKSSCSPTVPVPTGMSHN